MNEIERNELLSKAKQGKIKGGNYFAVLTTKSLSIIKNSRLQETQKNRMSESVPDKLDKNNDSYSEVYMTAKSHNNSSDEKGFNISSIKSDLSYQKQDSDDTINLHIPSAAFFFFKNLTAQYGRIKK